VACPTIKHVCPRLQVVAVQPLWLEYIFLLSPQSKPPGINSIHPSI
jgi:hypothetical protein